MGAEDRQDLMGVGNEQEGQCGCGTHFSPGGSGPGFWSEQISRGFKGSCDPSPGWAPKGRGRE